MQRNPMLTVSEKVRKHTSNTFTLCLSLVEKLTWYCCVSAGKNIFGIGYLLHDKWKDKTTGEERKQFKMRFTQLFDADKMHELSDLIENNLNTPTASASISSTNVGIDPRLMNEEH